MNKVNKNLLYNNAKIADLELLCMYRVLTFWDRMYRNTR